MKILGIDPGTTRIGYGLIERGQELRLLEYGVIEVQSKTEPDKLLELAKKLSGLIDKFHPDLAGVEKLYFAKNKKTALAVAQARGVIIHLLLERKVPIKELRPAEVKIAVTNYGFADKTAVAKMVGQILRVNDIAGYDDASDALAIAIAAAYEKNYGV